MVNHYQLDNKYYFIHAMIRGQPTELRGKSYANSLWQEYVENGN